MTIAANSENNAPTSEESDVVLKIENHTYRFVFDFGTEEEIPADFDQALRELNENKVVDLDVALNEPVKV